MKWVISILLILFFNAVFLPCAIQEEDNTMITTGDEKRESLKEKEENIEKTLTKAEGIHFFPAPAPIVSCLKLFSQESILELPTPPPDRFC